MSAYLIANVEIKDPAEYARYVELVPGTIARHGGRYLARGGKAERLEGAWQPKRLVILEFESAARAKEWWASEDYRDARALRWRAALTDMILVEGLSPHA
jgi:uncharacterized protein (DUF1330 family)